VVEIRKLEMSFARQWTHGITLYAILTW